MSIFWKLTSLGSQDNNFTIQDIESYTRLYNNRLSMFDIDLLIAVQHAKQYAQQQKNKRK